MNNVIGFVRRIDNLATDAFLLIKRLLAPLVEPAVRPVQRWDDARSAEHLRRIARQYVADAALIEHIAPKDAARMRDEAVVLWTAAANRQP